MDERLPAAFAYLLAAGVCLLAARREPGAVVSWRGRGLNVWRSFGIGLAVLALLKSSGIEAHLVNQLRDFAMEEGLYDNRRPFQRAVVGASFAGAFAVVLIGGSILVRRRWRAIPLAIAVAVLGSFIFSRAVSLHRLDGILFRTHFLGILVNIWVECALVFLVAAAVWFARPSGPSPGSDPTL